MLIEPAEALNIASSNALLKTLEEPGERIVIILLAEHYLKLPATIRSRMQHYAFDRIEPDTVASIIYSNICLIVVRPNAKFLMNLAESNAITSAFQLASSEWLKLRQEFIQDWQKLGHTKKYAHGNCDQVE